jgi:hypothetical protein
VPRTADGALARALHAALAALTVDVDAVACDVGAVALPSYPGGSRPTSVVRIGDGRGENVAWTGAAHDAFRARLDAVPRGRWRLAEWSAAVAARFADPYERAALEAAAIDDALRRAGLDVAALVDAMPRPVRWVVSFEKVADPIARASAVRPDVELKIDVDPAWDAATWRALDGLGRVAILDFKRTGTAADAERGHRAVPQALVEDPAGDRWSPSLARRIAFDAGVTTADSVDALPVVPAAVNLKPGRMGGVLEAVRCAARCGETGLAIYFGGMFEVGPGRSQLAALASVLCPDAPNDIAPLVDAAPPARLVAKVGPGFR